MQNGERLVRFFGWAAISLFMSNKVRKNTAAAAAATGKRIQLQPRPSTDSGGCVAFSKRTKMLQEMLKVYKSRPHIPELNVDAVSEIE